MAQYLLQRKSVENKFLYTGNQVFVPQQQKLGDVIVDDLSFDSDGTPESSYYDSDEEYFDVVWQGKKLNSN
ncbi:hypothetical protein ACVR05_00870 [Streptococcus caprae]|uniref:Uncharacterized protein n=1 Tax=Streptococcus caprae TaxID=1640501 RepID=A0ABV8CTL5_9STRE